MAVPVWLPGVVIGGGALAAIYFLSKGGGRSPIVSNALLPSTSPATTPTRDPARVAAFEVLGNVALGTQRLAEQSQSIAAQLDLGRFRLQEQSKIAETSLEIAKSRDAAALALAQSGQTNAIELERIRQEGQTNRLREQLLDRNYDRELQARALEQTYALAQQGQIGQGLGQLLSAILGAIRPRPASGSGGASGGAGTSTTPRTSPRYPRIPIPNVGPVTPPFFPSYPDVGFNDLPGFYDPFYDPYYAPASGPIGVGSYPVFGPDVNDPYSGFGGYVDPPSNPGGYPDYAPGYGGGAGYADPYDYFGDYFA